MSATKRLITVLAATFAILFVLAGCSSKYSGDYTKNFVGDWKLVEVDESGRVATEDDLSMAEAYGISVGLTVNENGTFTFSYFGEEDTGEWSARSATEAEFVIEGQPANASLTDEKLSIEQDGTKLVFGRGKADASSSSSYGHSSSYGYTDTVALGTVIADDDVATIVVVDKKIDAYGEPSYTIKATNNSDGVISLSASAGQWSVNGKMIDPVYYETVQPGKYAEGIMYFMRDDASSLDELAGVEGAIVVINDQYETVATYVFHE